MDIQEKFSKKRSPETYGERSIFVALGIYSISKALLSFINFTGFRSIFFFLHYSTALFGIVVGLVAVVRFGRKIRGDFLRQGLFGLGLWLIVEGLSSLFPPAEIIYFLKMALSLGAGIFIMIGALNRDMVRRVAGLFLLGFYLILNVVAKIIDIFYVWNNYAQISIGFALIFLLFISGLLLLLRRSDEGIVGGDVCGENPDVE